MSAAPVYTRSSTGLYIVRHYDGFDNCWTDQTEAVPEEEALAFWRSATKNGTKNTKFADIDYFAIFPSDTRMYYAAGRG